MSGNIADSIRFVAATTTLREHMTASSRGCALMRGRASSRGCALMRGRDGSCGEHHNLVNYAMSIGFSTRESYGIMDGWDVESGSYARHVKMDKTLREHAGYLLAYELGQQLYHEVGRG